MGYISFQLHLVIFKFSLLSLVQLDTETEWCYQKVFDFM